MDNGVIIIPPRTVSELDINRWTLFAASDNLWPSSGGYSKRNWSVSPQVLEFTSNVPGQSFLASYRFELSIRASYSFRVRLMDFAPSSTGNPPEYSPLTFMIDGLTVLTHRYGGSGPLWLTSQVGVLNRGPHTLELRAGAPGALLILSVDLFELEPV